jgi:thiol-disulfide isomerase/thioredoxin
MKRRSVLAGICASPILPNIAAASYLKTSADLQPLLFATGWLGERHPPSSLHGRVVLIDIFTFECINCTNITANLKRLYAIYPRSDLEIIGVHTPEVPSYQNNIGYLTRETRAAALPWPIAIDSAHRIWDAYDVSAWPTQLVFDRTGRLRATIVGDSQDEHVATVVRAIIRSR